MAQNRQKRSGESDESLPEGFISISNDWEFMMDWERFYRRADYDRCAYIGGERMADLVERCFDWRGVPDDFASVGCGPAVVPFLLAERHPETEIFGFDLSETVVRDNAEKAEEQGLDNLQFAVDSLPDLDTDQKFDVVYCVATLYFVEEPKRAIESLYSRVRDGGHLVLNYPNETSQAQFDREFEGRKRESFELVLSGANLISEDVVQEATGAETRNYWELVDAEGEEFVDSATPCVVVEK
ncbi:class I SAM-dependent methyltransferase [Haladaptatus cibarius]|uniref:class I SAM-dependent methyltransferase n=1 Tax=Haladaptatus cibarius TaxID=453847 RepID=UPI000A9FE3E3|nr:class I SAM-dependent methyltransferase [Haladaptatus cibarius]